METKKVVITGIGIASSIGIGTKNFISASKNGVAKIDEKELNNIASDYFGANIIRRMDSLSKYGILSSKFAYDDANLSSLKDVEIGGIFSTVWGPFNRTYDYYKNVLKSGVAGTSPLLFPSTVTNAVVGRIAKQLDLKGVSSMLVGTCPINYAYNLILDGKADIVLAGGIDDVTEHISLYQNETTNQDTPSIEGGFVVVLEEKQNALRRGAFIYAEIDNSKTGNLLLQNYQQKRDVNKQVVKRIIKDVINGTASNTALLSSSVQEILVDADLKTLEKECFEELTCKVMYPDDNIRNKFILPFGAISAVNTIISCLLIQDTKPELNEIASKNIMLPDSKVLINSYFYKGGVSSILLSKAKV
ncbi:MAG: hypothetical protein HOO91_17330 [Bacteroidales bacterium]|nr:hypothetical protein [Bacteroidales bacterium]